MWLVYFYGVFGGLMLIGHAAPFVKVQGGGTKLAATAVMFVAAGNLVGSIGGGLWAQRTLARFALALPIIIAIIAIVTLVTATSAGVTLTALTAVGVAYGCLIAVIPVIVLNSVGVDGFGYSFGRIFSAWGFAGLVAPSLAGFLFDYTGNYYVALYVALAAATVALGLIATLRSS
jgi:MFS transporter, OFA family, oxalate/formate antiporter